jgi:hypothetical protein
VAEVHAGKRPKPKIIRKKAGRTIVELDAETIARNPTGMRRYVPPDKTGHTAKPAVPATETQQQLAKPAVPSENQQCDLIETSSPAKPAVPPPENQQHGSRGQKRQLIAEKLLADPEMSDLAIARVVGVNRETVAKVRRGMVTRAASDA